MELFKYILVFVFFFLCGVDVRAEDSYLGLKYSLHDFKFEEAFGKPVYNGALRTINVVAGVKFSENFGLEIGGGRSATNNKISCVSTGECLPGLKATLGSAFMSNTIQILDARVRMSNFDVALVGYLPIRHDFRLIGSLRLTHLKLRASQFLIGDEWPEPVSPEIMRLTRRSFKVAKTVPGIMAGFEYDLPLPLKVRMFVDWRQTSRLKSKSLEFPHRNTEIRMKSGFGIGASIAYSF